MTSPCKRVRFWDRHQTYPSQHLINDPSPLESPTPLPIHPPLSRAQSSSHSVYYKAPRATRLALLHSLLRTSSSHGLRWNTVFSPYSVLSASAPALYEPATDPPSQCMQIAFRHSAHRFSIQPSNGQHVTVADILHGIYLALQQPLPRSELNRSAREEGMRELTASYHSRCNRFPDWSQANYERQQGFKRIDTLMGQTRFAGLSSTTSKPDVWTVDLC